MFIIRICILTIFIAATVPVAAINISSDSIWGLVKVAVAHVRTEPRHGAEMSTQAIMGTPIRVLSDNNGWAEVELPDGYKGYIINNCIAFKSDQEMSAWRNADRLIVCSLTETKAYRDSVGIGAREYVSDMVNGNIVEGTIDRNSCRSEIKLPDGRTAWIENKDVTNIKEWATQPYDAVKVISAAYSMMGTSYLWGGTSTKGVDCSGLVKIAYFSIGIITLRDASQQVTVGTQTNDFHTGDLLFFWNNAKTRVNHVAIYDRDGYYIQSAGRVMRSHLSPSHPDYYPNNFKECRTFRYNIDSPGIIRAISHPWYF